ncbi:hypothetical protein [Streptomyces spiralis]|uniref:hypothetical protein n=1 Tax=Streptomyces spiralis TaxID=66376 RepID=UPI00369294B5
MIDRRCSVNASSSAAPGVRVGAHQALSVPNPAEDRVKALHAERLVPADGAGAEVVSVRVVLRVVGVGVSHVLGAPGDFFLTDPFEVLGSSFLGGHVLCLRDLLDPVLLFLAYISRTDCDQTAYLRPAQGVRAPGRMRGAAARFLYL